ncbi:hypothetical protein AKG34_16925 [Peribacillus butanolivorans]|uniref:hypothetical protein n=1 Tax=Peribacillus butanolivorans TaxID=421767 RepID=UPI0006A6C682|nr:hypothetical protein [Peribacillus butanolivorans]KON70271.1 hypothetical protein AKG34_16925 [Peribacillus butanolivorans]
MDKSEKSKGIKIKINGEEKVFADKNKNVDQEAAGEEQEQTDDSFEWILPDDSIENKVVLVPAPKKKKMPKLIGFGTGTLNSPADKRPIKPFLIAVICAVFFGSILGLIAVKTITKEKAADTSVETSITTASPAEDTKPETMEQGAQLKTFLVQGGVFSSEDAAKQIQKKIIEKQVPAEIFKLEDSYYLFLGSAESLTASKELALFLKSYDVDVYWKEINFEAASKSQKDEETLDTMKAVYSSLAETSATKLRGKETTVNEETLKKNMEKLKGENLSSDLSQMNNNLSAAAKLITEYETSKKEEYLLQAQGSLLDFLLNYQKIAG